MVSWRQIDQTKQLMKHRRGMALNVNQVSDEKRRLTWGVDPFLHCLQDQKNKEMNWSKHWKEVAKLHVEIVYNLAKKRDKKQ